MLFNQKMKLATILLFSVFLAGCVGKLGGGVKEENRDTTGTYDGIWNVEVQKAAGVQYYGSWVVGCGDMRSSFNMRVKDGALTLSGATSANKAFVSSVGVFKLTLPLSGEATASVNSGTTLANGDRKMILTGTLLPNDENSKGYITYGIAEVGYGGCTAKTRFTLTHPANKNKQT